MPTRSTLAFLASSLIAAALPASGAFAAASPSATYRVTFTGLWTPQTHPIDFPPNPHFSPLIGAVHANPDLLWHAGAIATNGIESMAETGSKTALRNEVLNHIADGQALAVIESPSGTSGTGTVVVEFTATQAFPFASVVTMIAPSPDWFVGTHDALLFQDGAWVQELFYELLPFDAGTDNGVSYLGPDSDTVPQIPIASLVGYPVSAEGETPLPFATMRFTRLLVPPCPADFDGSGTVDGADLAVVLVQWGTSGDADLNADGQVDGADLARVLVAWGGCP